MNKNGIAVFIVDRIFWPKTDGHKLSLYNYCQGLSEKYGLEIHVLAFLENGQCINDKNNAPDFIAETTILNKPSRIVILKNLMRSYFIKKHNAPIQCSLFYCNQTSQFINQFISSIKPDYIFVDLIRLAPYYEGIKEADATKILYMEDVFSKRYERQLYDIDKGGKNSQIAGKYALSFSKRVQKISNNKTLKRKILKYEIVQMKLAEKKYVEKFNYTLLVSPKEANDLALFLKDESIFSVPLSVDYAFYSDGKFPQTRLNVMTFMGDMRTSANADSLRYIVSEVMPHVSKQMKLEIIGYADPSFKQEFESNDQIVFLGRVDDTREVIRSSVAFLAPIVYGTGIKTKILEAMAIGVPILTNSVGNEGINLKNGKEALISDDPLIIASYANHLIENQEMRNLLINNSRRIAEKYFDVEKTIFNFQKIGLIPLP